MPILKDRCLRAAFARNQVERAGAKHARDAIVMKYGAAGGKKVKERLANFPGFVHQFPVNFQNGNVPKLFESTTGQRLFYFR